MKRRGFTLVELLVVIVILAIILAIAIPGITNIIKSSKKGAFSSDAKMVLQQFLYEKLKDDSFDPTSINATNIASTCDLSADNYKSVTVTMENNKPYVVIVGKNKWDGLTAYGPMTDIKVVDSDEYDVTAPVITILGDNPTYLHIGDTYVDAGAKANDDLNGDVTSQIEIVSDVNTNIVGTYSVTYTVKDTSDNMSNATRNVIVEDVSAPVITVLGDNPASVNVGETYSDAGAIAMDDADGNVTSSILVTSDVNTSEVGTYTVTYTVSDSSHNEATLSRTVNVIDNVIPTVSFGMNGNTTYAKSRSTTVNVSDNVSLNIGSLMYQWTTSTTPPAEATFVDSFTNGGTLTTPNGVTGGYYLWIYAKDTAGNTMISSSNVYNLDNTAPVITINGNSSVTIQQNGTYSDAGATATDNIDGSVTVSDSSTVNTSVIGTYYVYYNVTDSSGNVATQVVRTVNVVSSVYNFNYTGSIQSVTLSPGTYKFEVWGAQGGKGSYNNSYGTTYGGYGGYSVGTYTLTNSSTLYVVVGGSGVGTNSTCTLTTGTTTGGYNGGGSYVGSGGASGGGATHIATVSGVLSNLSSNVNSILIVAGGGGGGSYSAAYGGSAGGMTGVTGGSDNYCNSSFGCPGLGGSQTVGGSGGLQTSWTTSTTGSYSTAGSFGQGGRGYYRYYVSCNNFGGAGGGGYYGGGGASGMVGGGGGSGYIGGVSTNITYGVTRAMYCYNCAASSTDSTRTVSTTNSASTATANYTKTGDGYARITYLGQ